MHRIVVRPLFAALLLLASLFGSAPAHAAVTVTFWSHEFGNSFPHAFVTLRGVMDAGGEPVDLAYGFTARSVTPMLLMKTVGGRIEVPTPGYIRSSDAQFSVVLSDAQYGAMRALIAGWDAKTGDARYNLNSRNCVHFVKEAAQIAGLTQLDRPGLMKRPRSYLLAVEAANAGRVTVVNMPGKQYLKTLPKLSISSPVATPTTVR